MGRCRFVEAWLQDERFKGWLEASGDFQGKCKLCRKTFSLGTMGVKAVESHMSSAKHGRNVEAASKTRGVLAFTAPTATTHQSTLNNMVLQQETQKAELLWVLHTVTAHHSFKSNEGIAALFSFMFPDSEYVKSFTCGEDKTAYLAKFGLAPFIKRELSQTSRKPFVVMFDESYNHTTKNKQMDIHIRKWSSDETGPHVVSRYYGSEFLGHSRAEDMLHHFNVSILIQFRVVLSCGTRRASQNCFCAV